MQIKAGGKVAAGQSLGIPRKQELRVEAASSLQTRTNAQV